MSNDKPDTGELCLIVQRMSGCGRRRANELVSRLSETDAGRALSAYHNGRRASVMPIVQQTVEKRALKKGTKKKRVSKKGAKKKGMTNPVDPPEIESNE